MEIKEAKSLKKELENQLAVLISDELSIFTRNTGLVIDSINVKPVYTQYLGSPIKDYVAVSVEVKIEI